MADSQPNTEVQQLLSSSIPIVIAPAAKPAVRQQFAAPGHVPLPVVGQLTGAAAPRPPVQMVGGRGGASAAPRSSVQVGVPGASAALALLPPVQEPEVGVPVAAAAPLPPFTGPAITASNRVLGKKAPQSGYHVVLHVTDR